MCSRRERRRRGGESVRGSLDSPPSSPSFRVPSWLRRIPELVRAFDATLLVDARCDERVSSSRATTARLDRRFGFFPSTFLHALPFGENCLPRFFPRIRGAWKKKPRDRANDTRVFFSLQSSLLPSSVRCVPTLEC